MRNSGDFSICFDGGADVWRTVRSLLALPLLALGLIANSACVTKSVAGTSGQLAVVFVQAPPGSLQTSGQAQLSATVMNDTTNAGVDWNASCGSPSCGSFNPSHTVSGGATVYTAPATVPSGTPPAVNITAMASANHAISQTVSIPIISAITIAFTQAPQNVPAGGSEPVVAQVTGDSSGKGVTWMATCAGSAGACGSFSLNQTNSGSATTYTAPPGPVPAGGFPVTIVAISTADTAEQVTANITVTPANSIGISFSIPPPTTLQTSGAANITATVTGSSTQVQAGADWTVTCTGNGAAGCGTFSAAHTMSGVSTTYTAPTTVPAGGLNVVIVAGATASNSGSGDTVTTNPATINITTPVVSISPISGAPSTLQVNMTAHLSVNITNDSATNGGATWSVTCGSAGNCGTFNPLKTTTPGSSATVYTAPPAVPTGTNVTVTAMSNADNTKTSTATIQITSTGTISIAFSPAPNTMMTTSQSQNITAVLTNDTGTMEVNWSISCTGNGTVGCGTIAPLQTLSGVNTSYTAPPTVPAGGLMVTVTAAAADSPGTTTSVTITVTQPTTTVTLSSVPSTLQVGAMQSITATVTNDPEANGVKWTCVPTGACGSFSPNPTTGNVSTTTYSAPPSIPTGGTVTITATAVDDASASANATITITGSQSNGLLSGQYAFSLAGTGFGGVISAVGSITADGSGNITAGEEDFQCSTNLCPLGGLNSTTFTGSTYSMTPDGRGTVTLQTGITIGGEALVQTLSLTVVNSARALVIEFDGNNASGTLDLQTPANFTGASVSGGYAFLFTGYDYNALTPADFGGVFTASSLSFTGTKDTNDQGASPTVTENAAFSGTFTAPDSTFGRGTFTSTTDGSTYVYYVVNSGFLKFLETDANFLGAGPAYTQGGSFSSGTTYVFTVSGIDPSPSDFVMGGTLSPSGATSVTGVVDVNIAGNTFVSDAAYSGTFTAPSGGRGTLTLPATITGGGSNPVAPGPSKFAMYLTANQGILLFDLDAGPGGYTGTGISFAQTATGFNTNYAGVISDPANVDAFDVVGQIIATAATPAFSGTVDINNGGTDTPGVVVSGSYTLSGSGRDTGSLVLGTTTLNEVFYVADANTVLCIETDVNTQASGLLQLQNPQLP